MNKKRAAFALFGEGKTATSPEVKVLKLKGQTRANYYLLWKKGREAKSPAAPSSETAGGIDETKQKQEAPIEEAEEAAPEKTNARVEGIGTVSEVAIPKEKEEKPEEPERRIATTITDEGIKCIVFLSLQTLALFRIASTTQAQFDNGEELSLGDFLDTCAEDFFRVRGKKLGLISSGGK